MRDDTDYCGPAGDNWFAKSLSKLIPDHVGFGRYRVYIGDCCKEHDEDNCLHGANKAGDEKFKECIRCKLKNRIAKWWYPHKYYFGVRIGAVGYKSQKEILKDLHKEFQRFNLSLRDRLRGK